MILPLWLRVRRYSQEMGSLPSPTGVRTKLLQFPEFSVLSSLSGHLSCRVFFFFFFLSSEEEGVWREPCGLALWGTGKQVSGLLTEQLACTVHAFGLSPS